MIVKSLLFVWYQTPHHINHTRQEWDCRYRDNNNTTITILLLGTYLHFPFPLFWWFFLDNNVLVFPGLSWRSPAPVSTCRSLGVYHRSHASPYPWNLTCTKGPSHISIILASKVSLVGPCPPQRTATFPPTTRSCSVKAASAWRPTSYLRKCDMRRISSK